MILFLRLFYDLQMYKSPLLHQRLKFIQSCKQRQTLYENRATKQTASSFAVLPLSSAAPAEAALCCGEAGEKEIESARGRMERRKREERLPPFPSSHRSPRASYFSIIAIFIGMPCGGLCGGDSCFAINLVRGREPGFHIPH